MDKAQLDYEQRDSVEVTRNAKGEYGWKIKRYYNASMESVIEVIDNIQYADQQLRREFLR